MIHSSTIEASVEITDDNYRYWLKRVWQLNKEIGVFIALNPSKATELKCDQTMCNINNLAIQWGWGGFYILNLFAYMSTDKNILKSVHNPVGNDNDTHIKTICSKRGTIIVSWGEEKSQFGFLQTFQKELYKKRSAIIIDSQLKFESKQLPKIFKLTNK